MARYAAAWQKTGADSVLQLMEVLADAATPRRQKWYDLGFGCTATSNDGVHGFIVRRVTGTATGTAFTNRPLDPADAAALADSKHLITADAASFATGEELYREPLNGRASWRWGCSPGGELVGPATASAGLSLGVGTASTSTYSGNTHFEEQ